MNIHTEEQFNTFLSQLSETNATLSFWTNFEKIKRNVAGIEIKLNTLNYLLGKQDLKKAVIELWNNDKSVFDVLQILIACRKRDRKKVINADAEFVYLEQYMKTLDGVLEFITATGLARIFQDKNVKNLVDYVFGVEVGLDSNARKNRSGDAMEDTVELVINGAGLNYRKEVKSKEWSEITNALGTDEKRFDFVIYTDAKVYLMEVNFYSGGGSKLNETARSFSEIGPKINAVPGFEFVWVTDGKGWEKAKNKLQEAFYTIPRVYNLTTLKDFMEELKINV
ncbi:type II restriction endonuclease [Xylanibacter caecicola]|uniref:type II restriction endonuclease n=1 Tax=Xylanibacter caecicola TaxID=2736294 RepID=UPI00258655F9|nr:type II restriction endonuclease [Xylanibacter caecicola]